MNAIELKNLFLDTFISMGKTPRILIIENEEYTWNGGQRIGNSTLFKYRRVKDINDMYKTPQEKQIMINNDTLKKLESGLVGV